jgi:hypothetical protein
LEQKPRLQLAHINPQWINKPVSFYSQKPNLDTNERSLAAKRMIPLTLDGPAPVDEIIATLLNFDLSGVN